MKQYLSVIDESSEISYGCKLVVGDTPPDESVGKIVRTFHEDACEKVMETLYRMYMGSTPQFVASRYQYAFDPADIALYLEKAFKHYKEEGDKWYAQFLSGCEITTFPKST